MKKLIISLSLLVAAATAQALDFGTISRMAVVPEGASRPVLSPDGKTLLYSAPATGALSAVDLESGKITVIDETEGSNSQPVFSADSRHVTYKTYGRVDGLVCNDVRQATVNGSSPRRTIAAMQRTPRLATPAATNYAIDDYKTIKVCIDGKVSDITPVADAYSYQYAHLSPDGKHIVFTVPFQGVFVCNADGSEATCIADKGSCPVWAGNSVVAYILSHDDGYTILSSQLVTYDLDKALTQVVTGPDVIAEDVTAIDGLIIFSIADKGIRSVTFTR